MNGDPGRYAGPSPCDDDASLTLGVALGIGSSSSDDAVLDGAGGDRTLAGNAPGATGGFGFGEKADVPGVPVATPASSQENPRPGLAGRMMPGVPMPPLPMMLTGAAANAHHPGGANHVSPATPMPPPVPIARGMLRRSASGDTGVTETPPASAGSQRASALAALYQSSRRSRTNTPGSRTPGSVSAVAMSPKAAFPPPPPLYAARSAPAAPRTHPQQGGGDLSAGDELHKVSLQSSSGASSSQLFHESWNTSMGSLMNASSFLNAMGGASFGGHNMPVLSQGGQLQGSQMQGFSRSAFAPAAQALNPGRPAPFAAGEGSAEGRPNLKDFRIEDWMSNKSLSDGSGSRSSTSLSQLPFPLPPIAGDFRGTHRRRSDATEPTVDERKILTVPTLGGSPTPSHPASPGGEGSQSSPLALRCMERLASLGVRPRDCGPKLRRASMSLASGGSAGGVSESIMREGSASSMSFEDGDDPCGEGPPKKKNKTRALLPPPPPPPREDIDDDDGYLTTPGTHRSTMSGASFDIFAHPSSRVSSMGSLPDDISPPDVRDLIRGGEVDLAGPIEADADKDRERGALRMMEAAEARRCGRGQRGEEGSEVPVVAVVPEGRQAQDMDEQGRQELPEKSPGRGEARDEKERRILRRKVQRLLLIRHCSTCPVPPPPPSDFLPPLPLTGDQDSAKPAAVASVCPVTSHCAEGKALCAHIRTCRDPRCTYKRCLTSREVLGHYKSCKDSLCQICGPVRALDRSRNKCHNGDNGRAPRPGKRGSGSSIDTIDDEGWLEGNAAEEGAERPATPSADAPQEEGRRPDDPGEQGPVAARSA